MASMNPRRVFKLILILKSSQWPSSPTDFYYRCQQKPSIVAAQGINQVAHRLTPGDQLRGPRPPADPEVRFRETPGHALHNWFVSQFYLIVIAHTFMWCVSQLTRILINLANVCFWTKYFTIHCYVVNREFY